MNSVVPRVELHIEPGTCAAAGLRARRGARARGEGGRARSLVSRGLSIYQTHREPLAIGDETARRVASPDQHAGDQEEGSEKASHFCWA
jgi:hypothetical protein